MERAAVCIHIYSGERQHEDKQECSHTVAYTITDFFPEREGDYISQRSFQFSGHLFFFHKDVSLYAGILSRHTIPSSFRSLYAVSILSLPTLFLSGENSPLRSTCSVMCLRACRNASK